MRRYTMKFCLMFIMLSGSYVYGMEEKETSKLSHNNQLYNNYYSQAVAGVEKKYQGMKPNATPLEIVGFLKTLHDGNWYKVDINIRSKL